MNLGVGEYGGGVEITIIISKNKNIKETNTLGFFIYKSIHFNMFIPISLPV